MDNRPTSSPPYQSKEEFLRDGLVPYILPAPLDCSICKEAITGLAYADATTQTYHDQESHTHQAEYIPSSPASVSSSSTRVPGQNSPPASSTHNTEQEYPAQVRFCGHVFGKVCLLKWFETGHRCPECNQVLFSRPVRHIRIANPSLRTREFFLDMLAIVTGNTDFARTLRENIMSDETRDVLEDVMLFQYRADGVPVTVEYVDQEVTEDDDSEFEDGDEEEDEFDADSEAVDQANI